MPRYTIKYKTTAHWYGWGDEPNVDVREVFDDGMWSSDRPTGILNDRGEMIYRSATRIGFLADREEQ